VDQNFGFGAVYSAPDVGFPEEGVVAMHPRNQAGWLCKVLDLSLLEHVRRDGQVLNFRDNQTIQMQLTGEEIVLRKVKL
jgi:hypothetical protein